jgi:hypothetical protein
MVASDCTPMKRPAELVTAVPSDAASCLISNIDRHAYRNLLGDMLYPENEVIFGEEMETALQLSSSIYALRFFAHCCQTLLSIDYNFNFPCASVPPVCPAFIEACRLQDGSRKQVGHPECVGSEFQA